MGIWLQINIMPTTQTAFQATHTLRIASNEQGVFRLQGDQNQTKTFGGGEYRARVEGLVVIIMSTDGRLWTKNEADIRMFSKYTLAPIK